MPLNSDSTNRNRIPGRRGGVSWQWTAMPDSHPDTHAGKSGGDRAKQPRLTLGDLPARPGEPDYRGRKVAGRAWEKSAEAVVVRSSAWPALQADTRGGPTMPRKGE
jgi:hypothetical protein